MTCKCICHTLNVDEAKLVSTYCNCCETCPKCYQFSIDEEHIENCNVITLFFGKRKN